MVSEPTPGRALYDRGWRQGVVFGESREGQFFARLDSAPERTYRVDGRLVLTTQDCDLVKPEARLPYLEAIPVHVDHAMSRSIRANDGRYFVLDPDAGLVADRAYRLQLSRGALETIGAPTDPPCGGDRRRIRRFGQWLGSAYDRPALPDEFNRDLSQPLMQAIAEAIRPGRATTFLNTAVHEVRAATDFTASTPWAVELLFILAEDAEVAAAEEAIAEVLAQSRLLETRLGGITQIASWQAIKLSEISVLDYSAAFPISPEVLSLSGETETGALPARADPD